MNDPLPTTLTDRIPAEIFDHIITHLCTSTAALSTCASVCKAWVPAARSHLLSPTPPPAYAFAPVVIRRDSAPALLALLASPHCTLRAHIRSVCIRPGEGVRLRRFAPPHLVEVERLMVCPVSYGPLRDDLIGWVAGYAHSLTELVLVGVGRVSFVRLLRLLGEVRGLRHVGLVEVGWADTEWESVEWGIGGGGAGAGAEGPDLRSLVLEDYSINVVNWLISVTRVGAPRITSLDLRVGHSEPFPSPLNIYIAQLITGHYRTLGGTLQELDLYELHLAPIDLQHTPNLRRIWFHDVRVGGAATGHWVTDALESVVLSSSVCAITLEIIVDPSVPAPYNDSGDFAEDWINAFDWEAFTQVLSDRGKFPQLKRVEVSLDRYTAHRALGIHHSLLPMGLAVRVVEMDEGPRFGFLYCGRVEERRSWETTEGSLQPEGEENEGREE